MEIQILKKRVAILLGFFIVALLGIPRFWQVIDCSFGVFGIISLWLCRNAILRIAKLEEAS